MRVSPIIGGNDEELWNSLSAFFSEKMKIPSGTITAKDVEAVRKLVPTRRSKTLNEVLVVYVDVRTRDMIQSYARNLAAWTEGGKSLAGIRLEIPDHLMGDFKSFEQYGHSLKKMHCKEFKRHIKFDDTNMCLFIDIKLPEEEWMRLDIDIARADNAANLKKKSNKHAGKLRTTEEEAMS